MSICIVENPSDDKIAYLSDVERRPKSKLV